MKKLLLALCLIPTASLAGTATLSWTPPTQNTDGSAYTNYGGFKIYYKLSGQPTNTIVDIPDPTNTITSRVIDNLGNGTWDFYMTAYNSTGAESDPSITVSKTIIDTTPLPPDPNFVTVETQIYNVVKKDDAFIFIYVGTAPLNTPCDRNQTVNGKYVVPRASVTWAGTVKPVVVVGTCSEK